MTTFNAPLDIKTAYELSSEVTNKKKNEIILDLNKKIEQAAKIGYFGIYNYHFNEDLPDNIVKQINKLFIDAGYSVDKKNRFTYSYSWDKED